MDWDLILLTTQNKFGWRLSCKDGARSEFSISSIVHLTKPCVGAMQNLTIWIQKVSVCAARKKMNSLSITGTLAFYGMTLVFVQILW